MTRDVQLISGRPLTVGDLPLGTEVQVQEHAAALPDQVRWTSAQWGTEADTVALDTAGRSATATLTVLSGSGVPSEVSLRIELTVDPGLAFTDGSARVRWTLAGFALLLAVCGAALVSARRPRHL